VTCVDGHDYIDLCLGDTGAMAGHGPGPTIAAVERGLRRGITHMLPTEDAAWVGEELTRRFGVGSWQFALSATDVRSAGVTFGGAHDGVHPAALPKLTLVASRARYASIAFMLFVIARHARTCQRAPAFTSRCERSLRAL
jgi:hypothetical protein